MKSKALKIALGVTLSFLYVFVFCTGFSLAYVGGALLLKNQCSLKILLMILLGIIITISSTILYKHLDKKLYKGEKTK